ncbi:MAG: S1 RNA-binding domain-containing protein [Anaerolineales bacterium]
MTGSASSPRRSLKEISPKQSLHGTITRIEPYGAYVDVGSESDGLLHISRIRKDPVNRIEDVLQPGQSVEVWASRIDPAAGRLEVTMLRPMGLEWKEITAGLRLTGKVVRVEKFGAFVDVGAERPGLVHVSEMGPGRRNDPADLVSVGDEVDVTILEVDSKKKQFRLSMKDSYLPESEEVEPAVPTAMELALRQALEGGSGPTVPGPAEGKKGRPSGRSEQEEILSRTLQKKVRTQPGGD